MPMFDPSVAMITSQQPRMAALPAKQYPLTIPTRGTRPLRRAKWWAQAIEMRDAHAVGVAGTHPRLR